MIAKLKEMSHALLKRNWWIVAVVATCFAVWIVVEGIFLDKMKGLVIAYIDAWNKYWFAGVAIASIIGWGGYFCYNQFKKPFLPSTEGKCLVLLLCTFYAYFRFIDDTFEFWTINDWVYLDLIFVLLVVYALAEICAIVKSCQRIAEVNRQDCKYLRDDAIEDAIDDVLGYAGRVEELAGQLATVDVSKRAYSVGISGEWGIGKSSFLNLFAKQQEETGNIVVRFAPRSAKKEELIANEFFTVLASVLSKYDASCDSLISRYAYTLQSVDKYQLVYSVLNFVFRWTSDTQKKKINRALTAISRRVYVIIEDLDRLTGKEILEVLKLIDSNGNFCNMIFMTAYDKDYVNGVLKDTIGYEDRNSYFTDKYFQYEYKIKRQTEDALFEFANKYVYEWALSKCSDKSLMAGIQHDWKTIWRFLASNLTTLRAWKRYVNLLRGEYDAVVAKVNFSDYALVTLIRYMDSEAYWALFEKQFITYDGKYFSDTDKLVLVKDFQKIVAKYSSVKNFVSILEFMFSEYSIRPDNPYGRIFRSESFENYFRDVKPGKLYYSELNEMMKVQELNDAIGMLERYISEDDNDQHKRSINEFLCSRSAMWIETDTRLKRYICLLCYAYGRLGSLEVSHQLTHMLTKDMVEELLKEGVIGDKSTYWGIVTDAMCESLLYVPAEICGFMIMHINQRRNNSNFDDMLNESIEQDVALAEDAQKTFDSLHGTDRWSAKRSLSCSQISISQNNSITQNASKQIQMMMRKYRDDYAKGMIFIESPTYSHNYSNVTLWSFEQVWPLLGKIEEFGKWIKGIKDPDVRFIVRELYKEAFKSNHARLNVAFIEEKYWTDYAYIADAIRNRKNE